MFSFFGYYRYFSLQLCCQYFDYNMPCYGLPWWLRGKQSACNAGVPRNTGSIPGPRKSPGGGRCNHSSILAWRIPWTGLWAAVHGHKESDMAEELGTCALVWFCFCLYWCFVLLGRWGARGVLLGPFFFYSCVKTLVPYKFVLLSVWPILFFYRPVFLFLLHVVSVLEFVYFYIDQSLSSTVLYFTLQIDI